MRSLFLFLLLLPMQALSCWDALNEPIRAPVKLLIDSTDTIVLAKMTRSESQGNADNLKVYHFEAVEVLKGQSKKRFSTSLYVFSDNYTEHTSYNNHEDKRFWDYSMGRMGYAGPGCDRPVPLFLPNKLYLIFVGSKDSKAYELIENPEADKWYRFVRNYIKHLPINK